jgi:hypothetical protein
LTVIRQQRHLATRVIISTQEPTIVPETFLDLCSLIIAHRFSSPKWLKHLSDHISTAEDSFDDLFNKVSSLMLLIGSLIHFHDIDCVTQYRTSYLILTYWPCYQKRTQQAINESRRSDRARVSHCKITPAYYA